MVIDQTSDHRFIWGKILYTQCFGYKLPPLSSINARELKTDDPACKERFLDKYEQFITDQNLHLMAYELQELLMKNEFTPDIIRRYDHLQQMRHKGIKIANKKCRHLKMGEVPWSATLMTAMDTIALWKVVVSRKRGARVSTRFLSPLEKKVDHPRSL